MNRRDFLTAAIATAVPAVLPAAAKIPTETTDFKSGVSWNGWHWHWMGRTYLVDGKCADAVPGTTNLEIRYGDEYETAAVLYRLPLSTGIPDAQCEGFSRAAFDCCIRDENPVTDSQMQLIWAWAEYLWMNSPLLKSGQLRPRSDSRLGRYILSFQAWNHSRHNEQVLADMRAALAAEEVIPYRVV